MSSAHAGSLHTSSFMDVLSWLVRDQRTGLLRLRHSAPEGAARGELVLSNGLVVGGAIYRAGGYKGMGDALVEAALCSPEDAEGAFEYAAQTAEYVPGALTDGAGRAGVSIERVDATLRTHLQWVFRTMSGWRAGSWEFLLEGLPADAADRDSAAARAFLLDRGLEATALDPGGDLSKTLVEKAAQVEQQASQDPEVTRKSKAVTAPQPAQRLDPPPPFVSMDTEPDFRLPEPPGDTAKSPVKPLAPPPSGDTAKSPVKPPPSGDTAKSPVKSPAFASPPTERAKPPVAPPASATQPDVAKPPVAPPASATQPDVAKPPVAPPASATQPDIATPPIAPPASATQPDVATPPAPETEPEATIPSAMQDDVAPPTAEEKTPPDEEPAPAEAAVADWEPPEPEPEPAPSEPMAPPVFDAPGSLPDEPTPGVHDGSPSPVFESPEGDLSGEHELEPPEPPAPAERVPLGTPSSSLGEADLFADADDSSPESDPPSDPADAPAAAAADAPADDPEIPGVDEPTHAEGVPAGEIDWSAPGGAEAALMEAETLLDSEVLSVMLEMGNSAAATATNAPGTERVLTGHVILADEEGQITGVVLAVPLRDAGYVVHVVRGLVAAEAMLDEAANDGQKPLLIADMLLKKGDTGMTGGLELVERAGSLAIPSILLGDLQDDARARADAAGVAAVLPRPMRSDLKDEKTRKEFVETVLAAIDEHRPRAEWSTPGETEPEALDTGGPSPEEGGWDVQEIEKKAEEVEDLPDFGMIDPAQRMDSLWRETVSSLSGPLTRPEILLQVLRFGAEALARAVLFTPNAKGELVGFGQFGIELAPGVDADQAVRHIRFPADAHPSITQATEGRHSVRAKPGTSEWEGHLTMSLGGITPEEVFFGPVFCQGRLAAVLYGDMLPEKSGLPDTTNLEVVLGQAGLALDRAELEARIAAFEERAAGERRVESERGGTPSERIERKD